MAWPAPKLTLFTFVVVTVLVIGGFAAYLFLSGSAGHGASCCTTVEFGPISITSLRTGSPFNPAGPVMNLTVQSTATLPIDNLTAQILVNNSYAGPEWVGMYLHTPPNITGASPLLPGQTALFVVGLIGPDSVTCGASFSVSLVGSYSGSPFSGSLAFRVVASEPLLCD